MAPLAEKKPAEKEDTSQMINNIIRYLDSIGATNEKTCVPHPKQEVKFVPLEGEALEKYNAEKAESEKRMAEWDAKREKEMEAEGGASWELLCDLRAAEAEKVAKGITGPALITSASFAGNEKGYTIQ